MFHKGRLFEGTGLYDGQSRLRELDAQTGSALREIALEDIYFGAQPPLPRRSPLR